MALEYKIIKAGGSGRRHIDFTVTFTPSNIADSDADDITRKLHHLLSHREIGNGVDREIDIFIRNKIPVVVFKYDDVGPIDHDRVEVDFDETMEHIRALLEVFNQTGAT